MVSVRKTALLTSIMFITCFIFSYLLFSYNKKVDVYSSLLLVITMIGLFIYIYTRKDIETNSYLSFSILTIVALHSAILLAFVVAHPNNRVLWPVDAYTMHVPGAKNISDFIHGTSAIRATRGIFDKIYFTQIFVGIFFSIFGVNPVSSGLALMLATMGTIIFIFILGKKMFGLKTANLSALIYSLIPTGLFYTSTFYKEAFIQLFVAIFCFSFYCMAVENKMNHLWLLTISLILLLNERFYLFPMFAVSLLIYFFSTKKILLKYKIVLSLFCLIGITSFGLYYLRYRNTGTEFSRILGLFYHLRIAYNSFADVNPINLKMPYIVSFVKLLFTPYFTLNKFRIYGDLSYLLIWGSFLNQIIIALSLYGVWKSIKSKFLIHVCLICPFLIFLILFAYIAPYNGRLRDSFYPLIVIYSSYGIVCFKQRIFLLKGSKENMN